MMMLMMMIWKNKQFRFIAQGKVARWLKQVPINLHIFYKSPVGVPRVREYFSRSEDEID